MLLEQEYLSSVLKGKSGGWFVHLTRRLVSVGWLIQPPDFGWVKQPLAGFTNQPRFRVVMLSRTPYTYISSIFFPIYCHNYDMHQTVLSPLYLSLCKINPLYNSALIILSRLLSFLSHFSHYNKCMLHGTNKLLF